MLEHALAAAARGWPVFPLAPGKKRPLYKRAFHDATTDEAAIRRLWAFEPNANIGIYPGGAGLMVLDVDVKEHRDGEASLLQLELEHGDLPETYTVRTPSGGRHLYYRAGGVPSSSNRIGVGLDVRAAGGYVVGAGSTTHDGAYGADAGADGAAPAEAPQWLVASAGRSRVEERAANEPDNFDDSPINITRAADFLSTTPAAIEGRGGDHWTVATAAKARDLGVTEGACLSLMLEHFNPRCVPPWQPDELAVKVGNAYRYAKRAAGGDALEDAETVFASVPITGATPQPPSRFRLLGRDEIMSLPEPRWLVDHTIPERGLCLIYGPYSSYKSFLALDMALHLAAGMTWAGHKCRPSRVAYAAGEGAPGIGRRLGAWERRHSPIGDGFRLAAALPMFADDGQAREFAEQLSPFRPDVVILDTLTQALAGWNENDTKDAALFMGRVAALRDALGCSIWLVHHTGKDGKDSRGSVVFPALSDTVLSVTAPRKLEAVVSMTKQKDAGAWERPQGFTAEPLADSLVFRPAVLTEGAGAVTRRLWTDSAVRVLEALEPGDVLAPLGAGGLAHRMAEDLGMEAAPAPLKDWLRKATAGHPLASWIRLTNGPHVTAYGPPAV